IMLALVHRVNWMGHEPLTASNGREALRLIQQEQPDLVLLNIGLPDFSGFEVLQRLNDAARISSSTGVTSVQPLVIMITANATYERAEAYRLGAVDFIEKPSTSDHITAVINKALATMSLRRQVKALESNN